MNVQTPLLSPSGDQTQRFNSQKFILQWLGIGYGYSFCCLFFYLFLFGGGIAVLVLTAVAGNGLSCECLETTKVLTMIAGGVLVVLASLWPCVWFWHQSKRNRSFTPFICYAWILSLCYFGSLCMLAVQVYEHHDLLWDPSNGTSSCTLEQLEKCRDDSFSSISLWTFIPMGGMTAVFFVVSCIACGCFAVAGSIW